MQQHKSILDSVNGKLASLKQELGPQDQVKMNEYTDAVRDVERRIQMAERQSNIELPAFDQPLGAPPVFEDHLALMMDLKVLAFQSDLTRVISFMISKEQSPRPYPQIGVPEAHHPLSHHNNIPELIEKMSKINTYHAKLFSQYLAKLKATPDGDGSLLDHITILYGAGISNSNGHSGDNLPQMLVGGGSGKTKGGRHLKYANKPSQANLLMTIMDKMDYPVEKVGGSNGKLPIDTLSEACNHATRHAAAARRSCSLATWSRKSAVCRSSTPPSAATKTPSGRSIQKKTDVNAAEPDGTTALHWAAYRDDLESADLLLKAGAKANAANDLGATPLWNASQNGSVGDGQAALGRRRESEPGAARGRNAGDGGRTLGLSRSGRAAARQGRKSECPRRARPDGADVGRLAAASRRGQGADRARRWISRLARKSGAK